MSDHLLSNMKFLVPSSSFNTQDARKGFGNFVPEPPAVWRGASTAPARMSGSAWRGGPAGGGCRAEPPASRGVGRLAGRRQSDHRRHRCSEALQLVPQGACFFVEADEGRVALLGRTLFAGPPRSGAAQMSAEGNFCASPKEHLRWYAYSR